MKKPFIAALISLLILIFPLRLAFLDDVSNVASLLSFIAVIAGYFVAIFLFNSDKAPAGH